MSRKVCIIDLTKGEQEPAVELTRKGKVSTCKATRARILLRANEDRTDEQIAAALGNTMFDLLENTKFNTAFVFC